MTILEMLALLDHPDPQVKKLAEHYGDLFDAANALSSVEERFGLDSEFAKDAYHDLVVVMRKQPNVSARPVQVQAVLPGCLALVKP